MFYIETVCDGGDFDLNFVKLLCFISSKFGDGKIIINNRQNFVVPNITITNSYEVKISSGFLMLRFLIEILVILLLALVIFLVI